MGERRPLLVPRVNANDEAVVVLRWRKTHGERVEKGTVVAEIETTKAIVDVDVDESGFLLQGCREGDTVAVGAPLGWLVDRYDPATDAPSEQRLNETSRGERLVSRDAKELMTQHGLSLGEVPGFGAVRKQDIERLIAAQATPVSVDSEEIVRNLAVPGDALVVYGADMQGSVVYDCVKASANATIVAFIDDRPTAATLCGVPILARAAMEHLRARGVSRAHVAISDPRAKLACAERLKSADFAIVGVSHPTAVVASSATLGEGVFLGPLTLVGPHAVIGDFAQINNAASVAHHSSLGRAARLSDGVRIAGRVTIRDGAFLGLGVTVNEKITIGENSVVVSGVSIFSDVPANSVVRVDGKAYPRR